MPIKDLDARRAYVKEYGRKYRAEHKVEKLKYQKEWAAKNPEKRAAIVARHLAKRAVNTGSVYYQKLKEKVLQILGNKCSNPNCRHLNEDNTLGCKDPRLLQVDHKEKEGNIERKALGGSIAVYRKIIRGEELHKYRLLCAQCNWLHRYEEF